MFTGVIHRSGLLFRASAMRLVRVVLWGIASGILCFMLTGCGEKEPPDPVETVKAKIPAIQEALNRRDIAALKAMGTAQFEANRFITDVFTHGVVGDVTLTLSRIRYVTGGVDLYLKAGFGENQAGGLKTLTIYFCGGEEDGRWRMNTYALVDEVIPPKEGIFDSLPAEPQSSDPS